MNKKIEEILERIEKESVRYFYSTHEEYESGFYASNAVGELIEIVKLLVEEVETLKDVMNQLIANLMIYGTEIKLTTILLR
jgi:hypothetical protein